MKVAIPVTIPATVMEVCHLAGTEERSKKKKKVKANIMFWATKKVVPTTSCSPKCLENIPLPVEPPAPMISGNNP